MRVTFVAPSAAAPHPLQGAQAQEELEVPDERAGPARDPEQQQ